MQHSDPVRVLLPHHQRLIRWAIALTVLVNAASMLTPIINEGDSVLYAALAQHMVNSGNWSELVLDQLDWLDKPHFPFWVGALSFKLLGISAFSYILPGFLFHFLGGTTPTGLRARFMGAIPGCWHFCYLCLPTI